MDKEYSGVHEVIFQSIMACDINIWKNLYSGILLSGGNTLFKGINKRLFKEISALAPSTMVI